MRFYVISFFFIVSLFVFIGKLIFIQLFHSQYLTELACKQHNIYLELPPQRGIIYDRKLKPLVVNTRSYSLFAVPNEIKNKNQVANILSDSADLDSDFILKRLSSSKHFAWLKRKLSDRTAKEIRDMNMDGLFFMKESRRSYPNGTLATHVLGFTNIDNIGLEGIELYCNRYLEGKPGYAFFVRDARQNVLRLENSDKLPVDGYDVVLTIDQVIQYIAENALDEAFKKNHAKGACIVVMDPRTGEILALANRPTYDSNSPQSFSAEERRNRAICDFFEPGSVFKIVTASAALEENVFKEEDRIFCENGTYRVANHILHDHEPLGWLTFSEAIEKSSNIGVTKIAQKLGLEKVYKYAKLFGFGSLTGIRLSGEVNGLLKPLSAYSKTSIGALPIGQEVGVTALQLACAISVVANGGLYYRPYIINKIKDKYDETIEETKPECVRRVITAETSQRLSKILERVVESGTGRLAKSKEYKFAGKTGTAQKVDPRGGYSHSAFFASFIGFAPAENPRLAIVVVFDEPHPYYYGGVVSAPVFKEVAEKSLKYIESEEKMNNLSQPPKTK
ncbi:MAG: penicillin-binding transpeptidase domain-containing protein [Candidatus Omnitrophica bacterium]|nr:penicillin-binding transpeptidase domain-containing protein [Candidatus Omnitrophota bacterium]